MKTKFLTIAILLCTITTTQAQEQLSLSLYQDARLLILGDPDHGYSAGTLDFTIRLNMQGNQQKYGYLVVFPEFEYANIQGIYKRWSANIGYTFNKLILPKTEASAALGFGFTDRYGLSFLTWSLNGAINYKISNRIKASINSQLVQRKDLEHFYNETNAIRFSGFIGIEVKLF